MEKDLKPIKVNYPTFELEEENKFKNELDKLTDDAFVNANTTRTIKNIRDTLIKSLKSKYKITDKERLKEISDSLLKIHGLSESNFDFMSSFSKMIDDQNKLNDVSIDDNSNKNEKNVKGSLKEIELAIDKLIGFDMLYRTMKELYGQDEAKKLSADMYDYSLGLSDSSSILIPYCWALDASKLVTCGRDFGQLPSKPSKRVSSYVASLCETIHQMSSHLAGAIAVGTFFLDISHLLIYKHRLSLDKIRNDKETRKIIENEFQQFIHSVNFLSRNGIESPFTNVSIFDHDKLASLIDDENYGWYFPKNAKVLADNSLGGDELKLSNEDYKEFVLDYIFEVQKIFIELFNEGDPLNGGIQYRFPVCFPGEEKIIINGKLTSFESEFKNFEYGWTDIKNTYTRKDQHKIKINKVFKGITDKLIKLESSMGNPITTTPEHKLLMVDGTLKKVSDINVGDKISLYKGVEEGKLKSINVSDILGNLWVLGYKIKYNDETKDIFKNTEYYDWNNSSHPYNFKKSHPLEIIKKLDRCNISVEPDMFKVKTKESKQKGAILNNIKLDYDFGRFLGLFYAEGHNCGNEIGFSFNINEKEYISFITNYIKNILMYSGKIRYQTVDGTNGIQIIIDSKTLSLLLDELIGRYSYNKNIKDWLIFDTSNEFRKGLITGIIEGDGTVNEWSSSITTVSKYGADSICLLCNSIGINSKITYVKLKENVVFPSGIYDARLQYVILLNKKDMLNNLNFTKMKKFKITGKTQPSEYYLVTKKDYIELQKEIDVYNVEVDSEDHIFTLPNGVQTSNCTVNLSKHLEEDGKYHIDKDNELKKYIVKKDIARYNIFTSEGTKVASCCRLISDKEMLEMSSSVNSFGGSNISLGSHRVITTNFARIAYEATNYDDYLKILRDRVEKSARILKAHRVLILKLSELGLQPFIKNGWINMDRMFSTFGVLGIVEADKILKERFNHKDFDYMADILIKFNEYTKEEAGKLGFIHNIEQIPGESFAVRLASSDNLLFGNPYDIGTLYSNQFVSLWEDKTINEKINRDGQLNKLLSGGGIVHINVKSSVTPTQAEKIIDDTCEAGSEHFAINLVYSKCEDCNLVVKDNLQTCPKCNSKHITHFTRIIGYFSPVESWSKVRREDDFVNRKFIDLK